MTTTDPLEDVYVRIASLTQLTPQDLADMQACNPTQLAALMRGYENDGKVANSGVWSEIATILQGVAAYAPLAGTIVSIVSGVAAI
jgi:hypothetical protein